MANTVTQRTLLGAGADKNIYRMITIVSDGTEESALVVYDNSAFVADVSKGKLMQIWASGDDCVCRLEFDATANTPCFTIKPGIMDHLDFRHFGGISNNAGTGVTGDIVLSTADLDAGDELSIILHINQA